MPKRTVEDETMPPEKNVSDDVAAPGVLQTCWNVNSAPPVPVPQPVPVEKSSPAALNCAQPAVEVAIANVPELLEPTESIFHGVDDEMPTEVDAMPPLPSADAKTVSIGVLSILAE